MKTISLCMIVKNEEKYLEQCLASVAAVVDEIIVVDTGSADNTIDIAYKYNSKVYQYYWDDNFSNARNYSLSKATSDWILVLDADEAIHEDDLLSLIRTANNTSNNVLSLIFNNYIDDATYDEFTTHTGLRLFKNHEFCYEGSIHEQLVPVSHEISYMIEPTNVRVLHYGYLPSNSISKHKHGRNIPLIAKLLEIDPSDSFQLFNMGNEYMNLDDYEQALKYYEKSCENKDITLSYCSHLLFRKATCLHYLERNEEALLVIAEGIGYYPNCVDYYFLRGSIEKLQKQYTMAIDSFNQCLSMSDPPQNLVFINDTKKLKPLIELGHIYYIHDDWNKALDYYGRALDYNGKRYDLIYKIGEILNHICVDKSNVTLNLDKLFLDSSQVANVIVISDILLNEGLYDEGNKVLNRLEGIYDYPLDQKYLIGRLYFYGKDYDFAFRKFHEVLESEQDKNKSILNNIKSSAMEYLIVCYLLLKHYKSECNLLMSKLSDDTNVKLIEFFVNDSDETFTKREGERVFALLSRILEIGDYNLFEETVPVLNRIDSRSVLLDLAKLYYKLGYKDLAVKNIMRSVKELDIISSQGVYILNREFYLV